MRRTLTVCFASALFACVPDLDVKASRVVSPRVVAVRATPAEATPGISVTWDAIVVTPLPAPARVQVDWAMCAAPRNPSDSITVTTACFAGVDPTAVDPVVTVIPGSGGTRVTGTVPADACRKIGPEVPQTDEMGQSQRPPDADITGGYQLPLRMVVSDDTGAITDISFDRQRVRCNLAAAPVTAAREFAMRYVANTNPIIESVLLNGAPNPADGSVRFSVPRGLRFSVGIRWPAASRESYVLFDPVSRAVRENTETLDIAWYTNGGEFERDRTTADTEGGTESSNVLIMDPDITETITMWVVLRDDRGGVGTATLLIDPV